MVYARTEPVSASNEVSKLLICNLFQDLVSVQVTRFIELGLTSLYGFFEYWYNIFVLQIMYQKRIMRL